MSMKENQIVVYQPNGTVRLDKYCEYDNVVSQRRWERNKNAAVERPANS